MIWRVYFLCPRDAHRWCIYQVEYDPIATCVKSAQMRRAEPIAAAEHPSRGFLLSKHVRACRMNTSRLTSRRFHTRSLLPVYAASPQLCRGIAAGYFRCPWHPLPLPGFFSRSRLLQPSRDLLAGFPLSVEHPRVTVYLGRRRVPIAANTASRDYGKLYRIQVNWPHAP